MEPQYLVLKNIQSCIATSLHKTMLKNSSFNLWINVRPNKVKKCFWSSCLVIFLPSENIPTDRQIITKRHYDRKITYDTQCIQTVMLLNMHKNLEKTHIKSHIVKLMWRLNFEKELKTWWPGQKGGPETDN